MAGHSSYQSGRLASNVLSERSESKGSYVSLLRVSMDHLQQFFVYILRCSDGSYYVGHTDDLELRVQRHNDGRGAGWTAARRPVELVYQESFTDLAAAVRREGQLKKWSRAKKEALIAGDPEQLKQLSKQKS